MSEDKKIRVQIVDDKSDEGDVVDVEALKQERNELRATLESLAEAEFNKKKEELANQFPEFSDKILDFENPDSFESYKEGIESSGVSTHKTGPSGIVNLPSGKGNIMTKEFPTAEAMVTAVRNEARTNPDMENVLSQLMQKAIQNPMGRWTLSEPLPKIKSPSQRYVLMKNSYGNTCYVPENHAKTLDPELLKKRLASGYYG